VTVFEPDGQVAVMPSGSASRVPAMTPGRAALIGLMQRYLDGLMDPIVTLLEVHKLMYFMQEAGEPLRLRYLAGPYGPYAENLRHVLQAVDGHFVSGYTDGGDEPGKQLELVPGASDRASSVLDRQPETRARFERVARLVQGFESPFGLELLATVHWIVTREGATAGAEIVARAYQWAERKRQFSDRQLRLAIEVLVEQGWLPETVAAQG